MRTIRLAWMYHNLMDLYGDKGNITVFKKRCQDREINCIVDTVGIGQPYDFSLCDILFIGGGADKEQGAMYHDLVSRKENIQEAINNGVMVLLICGGYQLFGKYYEDQDGNRLDGLGILDYYTKADGKTRAIGNIVVEAKIDGEDVTCVGFENHGGRTFGVNQPFGKVIFGKGNENNGYEGYYDGQILGTYMHGPLLPKNVKIADYFIKKALEHHGEDSHLSPLDDTLSNAAKEHMLHKLLK